MDCLEKCFRKDKMEEECGVFGVFSKNNLKTSHLTYYALYALQHRGQESAGISVFSDGNISTFKGMGLAADVFSPENLDKLKGNIAYALQHRGQESAGISVFSDGNISTFKGMGLAADVFSPENLDKLKGNIAIGHVRYSTTGESRIENAQPLDSRFKLGQIAVAHNGNLTNSKIIRELLEDGGATFSTTIDSEVIIKMIARKAAEGMIEAVRSAVSAIKGAYALVIIFNGKLIGVRDPYGIRPLCLGTNKNGDYFLASESCAVDAVGGEFIRERRLFSGFRILCC